MQRIPIIETINKVGEKVKIQGWVRLVRDHGKVTFVDVRDYSGIIQVVFVNNEIAHSLHGEDTVEIEGTVQARKEGTVNKDLDTGAVEILGDSVKVIERAQELPIDMGAKELNVEIPTLLDYRSLTLRHPKVQAVFKVQEIIINAFREALQKKGFTEFSAPAIVPTATEGGAEVFPVKYFEYNTFLGQSPQFYKQIMVGVFERVFTVAKAYRAEPSVTTRHLTEYVSLDAEFGFINDFTEVMDMVEYVIRYIFNCLEEKGQPYLKLYGATVPALSERIPHISLEEAKQLIFETTGRDIRKEPDLDPQGEKDMSTWALKNHGSELVFITHYPTSKRPFYTYPTAENPEITDSFDLIGRGVEWVTGGRRINSYEKLVANIKKIGGNPAQFETYLQAFKYGLPPEGGFALGAERITMNVLGLSNIREASAFPRDMERVDVRLRDIAEPKK